MWEEVVQFCEKLSALPDEVRAGRKYRLPTEAEWEYACRAGTTTKYSFGDDESNKLPEYAWFGGNSRQQTHQVGQKKANSWGLFDMHGNVWEMCSSYFNEEYVGNKSRVSRGGSWGWNDPASSVHCSSTGRGDFGPSDRRCDLGFRLAIGLPGAQPVSLEGAAAK